MVKNCIWGQTKLGFAFSSKSGTPQSGNFMLFFWSLLFSLSYDKNLAFIFQISNFNFVIIIFFGCFVMFSWVSLAISLIQSVRCITFTFSTDSFFRHMKRFHGRSALNAFCKGFTWKMFFQSLTYNKIKENNLNFQVLNKRLLGIAEIY